MFPQQNLNDSAATTLARNVQLGLFPIHNLEQIKIANIKARKFKHARYSTVKLKNGTCVLAPKAFKLSRSAAGQVSITDPYELSKHIYVGTSLVSGMGGTKRLPKLVEDRQVLRHLQATSSSFPLHHYQQYP
jgi:hypothetical protein